MEFIISAEANEQYVIKRMMSEKRNGVVKQIAESKWKFSTYVYDPYEMVPWVRTFTGRILDITCDTFPLREKVFASWENMAMKE